MDRYEALQHAVRAHGDETDWGGQLYVLHPMAVADRIAANWEAIPGPLYWELFPPGSDAPESAVVVALLHDVWEDTEYELERKWFTDAQWDALDRVTQTAGIALRGAGAEEAPGAYKRLPDVLEAMGETIEVVNTLRPVGVAMAPNGVPADD